MIVKMKIEADSKQAESIAIVVREVSQNLELNPIESLSRFRF